MTSRTRRSLIRVFYSLLLLRWFWLGWRSAPDQTLLDAAKSGELQNDDGLTRQFNRLLADSKAARFFSDFTGQWLDLRKVHDTSPDRFLFPEYFCDNYPLPNLFVSVLQLLGIETDQFASSTGTMKGLEIA